MSKLWIIILVIVSFGLGSQFSVHQYKHGCERIMNHAQTDSWLECNL